MWDELSIIWLDANVKDNQQIIKKLCSIKKDLKKFNSTQQCQEYLSQISINDRLILIVSGQLGKELVPAIHHLEQIISIYIYCLDKSANQLWSSQFNKIKDIVISFDDLVRCLSIERRKYEKLNESFSFNTYSSTGQSTTGLNGRFLFSQISINCLLRLQSNEHDKKELFQICYDRCKDSSNELNHLFEFQSQYSPDRVLWWYTREAFFYKILNHALRTQDIHLIYLLRSYIFDIEQQLEAQQFNEYSQVYRAQLMSNEELDQLKQSIGHFISINAFFSTSQSREYTKFILGGSMSTIKQNRILFEIYADPELIKKKPFADISQFSDFPNECEVLFMIGSIFRVKNIFFDREQIWNIQLDLCSDSEHDLKEVLSHMTDKTGNGPTNLRTFGQILWDMGELDLATKYLTRLADELPSNDQLLGVVYEDLSKLESQKRQLDKSLAWLQKSLAFKRQYSSEMIRFGSIYGNVKGGSSFDDSIDLELPPLTLCIGVEAFWKPYLLAIRFIYDRNDRSYPKIYHGNEDNTPHADEQICSNKFMLIDDEKFDGVIIHVGEGVTDGGYIIVGSEYIRFVTGIEFHTTKGRRTRLYGLRDQYEYRESFDGYVLGYARGRSGLVIDEIQFIWSNQKYILDQPNDIPLESKSEQTSLRWCCWRKRKQK